MASASGPLEAPAGDRRLRRRRAIRSGSRRTLTRSRSAGACTHPPGATATPPRPAAPPSTPRSRTSAVERVIACIDPANAPSIAVAERLGHDAAERTDHPQRAGELVIYASARAASIAALSPLGGACVARRDLARWSPLGGASVPLPARGLWRASCAANTRTRPGARSANRSALQNSVLHSGTIRRSSRTPRQRAGSGRTQSLRADAEARRFAARRPVSHRRARGAPALLGKTEPAWARARPRAT